eukprot:3900386-Prymnesium_polylepis.4
MARNVACGSAARQCTVMPMYGFNPLPFTARVVISVSVSRGSGRALLTAQNPAIHVTTTQVGVACAHSTTERVGLLPGIA